MKEYQNKRGAPKLMLRIQVAIIFLITALMIFLIVFSTNKMDQILDIEQEALLMSHDPNSPIHHELAKEIIKFRPDVCKMIEAYSKDLVPLFKVQFLKENDDLDNDITKYPELMELLVSNTEGHTSITIDDKDEDVYFRWTESATGEPYLVIIYMSRPVVENLWVFSFICYMILFLIFILLMISLLSAYNKDVRYYHSLSREVQSRIMRD